MAKYFIIAAWLLINAHVYANTCTVADNFTSRIYSQNNGTDNWTNDWIEVGESNGPNNGIARVRNDNCSSGNCLRLGVPSGSGAQTYSNIGVFREVDLSAASSATLTFNYRTGYGGGTPLIRLWVSNNGGASWFVIQQYSFSSTSFNPTTQTFDLTPYISSNTQIRFLADGAGAVSGFYIDDVQISYDCPPDDVTPILDYQFDECSYTGSTGDVIDQTGNFNGTSHSLPSPITDSVINRSADFSDDGRADWLHLPSNAIDGLDALSISVWFKTATSKSQQEIFHALGSGTSDDELEIYLRNNNDVEVKIKDSSVRLDSSITLTDNSWHHLVLTRLNDDVCLYIDGSLQECHSRQRTGPLSVPNANAVVLGQEQDAFGGGFSTSQNFEGQLDEFKVFNSALNAAAIANIYSNELAGNNYDGATRGPVDCGGLLAFYQFEQDSFSSNIIDSSGNDNHGSNDNGISTADGKYCRAFDTNGFNNSINTDNAFVSNLDLDSDVGRQGSISFWFNSNNNWNASNERTLFDASCNRQGGCSSDKYFTLEIRSDGRLKFSFEDSRDRDFSFSESRTVSRQADTWYYITATWDYSADQFRIYVDGSQVASSNANTNGAMRDFTNIVFGDNSSSYARSGSSSLASTLSANGKFDEVRIYNYPIDSTKIAEDMQGTNCNTPLDFYRISHDGSGITCMPEPVEVVACTDATCNTTDTSITTDVTLQLSNGNTQTVSVVNGVGNTNFNYTDTTTPVELSLSSDYQCENTVSNTTGAGGLPCQLTFSNTGFVFSDIPNQVSGVKFSGVTLRAVADNNGVCEALISDTTDIGIAMQYQDPVATTVNEYQIGGSIINAHTAAPPTNGYTDIPLTFDNAGTSTIDNNNYYDAGQIRLHARVVIPASGVNPSVVVEGSSNQFWVRPYMLDIASSIQGNGIFAAGDDFSLNIIAENADGSQTFNYEPTDIELAFIRNLPTVTGSVDGTLNYGNGTIYSSTLVDFSKASGITSGFSNGSYSTDSANFSEVGNYTIDVRENNYAGLGLPVEANALVLQRFTPKHFIQTVARTGEVQGIGTCDNWHYSGQPGINYRATPQLKITAVNAKDEVTQNYRDFGVVSGVSQDFMRLADDDVTINSPTQDIKDGALGVGNPYLLTGTILTPTNAYTLEDSVYSGGVYLYQLNANDSFKYTRNLNAVTEPFNAEFDLVIASIEDSDGVTASSLTDIELRSAVEIRFGRLVLENSYGPETESLPQSFSTEFISNTASGTFITNVDDNCTDILRDGANWTFFDNGNGILPSDMDAVTGSEGALTSGLTDKERQTALELKASSIKQGSIDVQYETPAWLQFDWVGDGLHDNNANAVATFGLFRGNDRIIYWREVNQ